jgi:hypothetical protein
MWVIVIFYEAIEGDELDFIVDLSSSSGDEFSCDFIRALYVTK